MNDDDKWVILFTALSTLGGAIIGGLISYYFSYKNEKTKDRRQHRVQALSKAYKNVAIAHLHFGKLAEEEKVNLEQAIIDIQLYGTQKMCRNIYEIARINNDMQAIAEDSSRANRFVEIGNQEDKIKQQLIELRQSIREELGLEELTMRDDRDEMRFLDLSNNDRGVPPAWVYLEPYRRRGTISTRIAERAGMARISQPNQENGNSNPPAVERNNAEVQINMSQDEIENSNRRTSVLRS